VERTCSDPNTVAAILRRLEQRRLVRREAHARDRRARSVYLTAEGQRVQLRAAKDAEPIVASLWDCMVDCDRGQVGRFLRNVHQVFGLPLAETNGRPTRRRPPPRRTT
jgi:DNA-binding MarR family transcriptional regulator